MLNQPDGGQFVDLESVPGCEYRTLRMILGARGPVPVDKERHQDKNLFNCYSSLIHHALSLKHLFDEQGGRVLKKHLLFPGLHDPPLLQNGYSVNYFFQIPDIVGDIDYPQLGTGLNRR